MRIRFWGTRGSLPKPSPEVMRYGGNTSCVEVQTGDGTRIVLDCGTGAHGLGKELAAAGGGPPSGHLLITHTHWDHIQGFPFFAPLFIPGARWEIYAPGFAGHKLESILSNAMSYSYFPVSLGEMGASLAFHDLMEGAFELGPARVRSRYANHPTLTLGYRIEAGGASLAYIPDHEPNALSAADGRPLHREDLRHAEFLAGTDLLIHDAQYTLEEYRGKTGWGHSPAEQAVDYALAGGVRRLALFHHDPWRDDEAVDRMVEAARRRAEKAGGALDVFGAAEGRVIELPERTPARAGEGGGRLPVLPRQASAILVVDEDPEMVRKLQAAMPSGDFYLLAAQDRESAIRLARETQPSLLILEPALTGTDGWALCRDLRAEAGLRDTPILIYTGKEISGKDLAAGYAAGATDWMMKAMPPVQLRARVCAWLIRGTSGHAPG